MSELEDAWAGALAEAEARARAAGRNDISEYLALRSSNDLMRTTAVNWLLGLFAAAAGAVNRAGAALQIVTGETHQFKVGNATMVGPRLVLGSGERSLTVETGWPRTPRDGFISGGGLACGNIKHRGLNSANDALRLVLSPAGVPSWIVARPGSEDAREFHEADVTRHFRLFFGEHHPVMIPSSG